MIEYFIKNLIFFALTIVTFLIFRLILNKSKFKSDTDSNVLRFPLAYRLAPLCTVGYFVMVMLLVMLFAKGDLIYVIVASIVALGGIVVMIYGRYGGWKSRKRGLFIQTCWAKNVHIGMKICSWLMTKTVLSGFSIRERKKC